MAVTAGSPSYKIGDDSVSGFSIDGATAMLADEGFANVLSGKEDYIWDEVIIANSKKDVHDFIYEFDGNNIALFTSGYGDGHYVAYKGLDSQNRICRLLIDFGTVDW